MPASAARRALRSSRSAASGITPPVEDGLRASPYTVQPCSRSRAARLPPTIPVLPAINATRPVFMFLLAPPVADISRLDLLRVLDSIAARLVEPHCADSAPVALSSPPAS